jgi:hypothetical protein
MRQCELSTFHGMKSMEVGILLLSEMVPTPQSMKDHINTGNFSTFAS